MNLKKLTKAKILELIDNTGQSLSYLKKLNKEELIAYYQNNVKLEDDDVILNEVCLSLAQKKLHSAVEKVKELKLLEMNSDEWIDFIIQKAREAKLRPEYKNRTLSSLIDGQDFYHKKLISDARRAAENISVATKKEYENILFEQLQEAGDQKAVQEYTAEKAKKLFAIDFHSDKPVEEVS